ncbi:MAG: insulinase family protein [Clostridiales bacterium]|nr:insulinase family protein [Clostridiales bacterium]
MPSVTKLKIKEGLDVQFIDTDQFKTNYFSVSFSLPITKENAPLSTLLPKVLMRGCEKYPTMTAISKRLDDLYAADVYPRVFSRGETQFFGLAASMLKDRFAQDGTQIEAGVFELFSQLLFHPLIENGAFKKEYVETEKKQIISRIRAQKNDKRRYAVKRCEEEMCADEAYGIPTFGYEEDVAKITPESLYQFYQSVITGIQCHLYFIGHTNTEHLKHELASMFSSLAPVPAVPNTCQVIRQAGKIKEITDVMPAEQSKLTLGFRTGTILADGNWHVFSVFMEIFGLSPASKLFMNVREKLSLCYYCSCNAEPHKGIMLVYSGITAKNKEKAQSEILDQLKAIQHGDIAEEELNAAKLSVINAYRSLSDSPVSLEGWFTGRKLAGLTTTPEDCIPMVMAVTKEQVMNIAQKISLDTIYFMKAEGLQA